MLKIDEVIERCANVVADWHGRTATIETVRDFAAVFDMEMQWGLARKAPVDETPNKATDPDDQYELFNEMSAEDRYAMKSWRENNGLAWR
jgi:hypothetical protein